MKFVDKRVNRSTADNKCRFGRVEKIRNVGSFLSKIKDYSLYEQYYACGLNKVNPDVGVRLNEVPKGLIKLCKEQDIEISKTVLFYYKESPDLFNNLLQIELATITKENIVTLLCSSKGWYNELPPFKDLITNYGYKPQSLLAYIDNLMTYEALDNYSHTLKELSDYVKMMEKISPKYEKYPKNFLTTHKIACRNYNRLKEKFDEEDFNSRINNELEYTYGDYKFVYPKSTQDIKNEAVQQNHCVASYIKEVIEGRCHILFMRTKKDEDKSLVTIEVRNGKVVQARGRFNRETSQKEKSVIEKYNKRLERIGVVC